MQNEYCFHDFKKITSTHHKQPHDDDDEAERPCPGFMAELLAHPVYSLASKINSEYFEAVACRRAVSTRALRWHALLVSIGVPQRLAVV
jgi:hypothetical protein